MNLKNTQWGIATEYTKDILPGAILEKIIRGPVSGAIHEFTICYVWGRYIPVHGMVKMAPCDTEKQAKRVLKNYWDNLKDNEK